MIELSKRNICNSILERNINYFLEKIYGTIVINHCIVRFYDSNMKIFAVVVVSVMKS